MKIKKFNFTLIELLIVIIVIAIISGMLMAAMESVIKRRGKVETKAVILTLMDGLKKYEEEHGDFPDSNVSNWNSSVLYDTLVNIDKPYCEIDNVHINENNVIVDSWGNPIYYVTAKYYHRARANDDKIALTYDRGKKYRNSTTYVLRSFGENGRNDKGKKDDVQI